MKTNTKTTKPVERTAEGAPAKRTNDLQKLNRLVMSCFLWENEFYVDGEEISKAIINAVANVTPEEAMQVAIDARTKGNLRHVPLLIARAMAKLPSHRNLVAKTLVGVIQRADELSEFLAIYWRDGKEKLANQVKKGLAQAFGKFNEYSISKYNRDNNIKLRDVLFLVHPEPKDKEQEKLWKKLTGGYCDKCWKPLTISDAAKKKGIVACKHKDKIEAKLAIPDTWETSISACGTDLNKKSAEWKRLVSEDKLGALALLRNLRNMEEAGVDRNLVRTAISKADASRVLPFRFIAAAKFAPHFEPELEEAMFRSIKELPKLKGRTVLLVDVSGSMDEALSGKSDMTRIDAACGLAMIAREVCESVDVITFSDSHIEVPARRGFALRDAVKNSQEHSSTYLGKAVGAYNKDCYERMIVISDEQSSDPVPNPTPKKSYMINPASNENGVGYGKHWLHLDGFSEAVIKFIIAHERS